MTYGQVELAVAGIFGIVAILIIALVLFSPEQALSAEPNAEADDEGERFPWDDDE